MPNIDLQTAFNRASKTFKKYIDDQFITNQQFDALVKEILGEKYIVSLFGEILSDITKWTVFGDSISVGYTPSGNVERTWHANLASQYTNVAVTNVSATGSEIAETSNTVDSFLERCSSLPSDTELLTVFGGVNDWGKSSVQLGDYESTNTGTFYGALNTLIPGMKAQCPNARIIWMLPLSIKSGQSVEGNNTDGTNGLGLVLSQFIQAIRYKCHQYNIEIIDLYNETSLQPDNTSGLFHSDGLHPLQAGQDAIAEFMKTVMPEVPSDTYSDSSSGDSGGETETYTNTVTVESLHNNNHFNLFYAIDASNLNSGDVVAVSWTYSNASTTPTNFNDSASFYASSYENAIRTSTSDGCAGGYDISQSGNFASGTSTMTVGENSNTYPYFLAMTSFGALSTGSLPITWTIDSISVTVNGVEVPILGAGGFFTDESIIVDMKFGEINSDSSLVTDIYTTDGLVLCYDGIQNTRAGHDSALSGWEDLSGNNNDLVIPESKASGLSFGDNYLYCQIGCENTVYSTNGVDADATSLTFEIVVQDLNSSRYPQWYACTRSSSDDSDYVQLLNSTATQLVTTLSNEEDQFLDKPSDSAAVMSLVVTYDRSTNTMKSYLNNTEITSYTTTAVTDDTRFLANQLLLFSAGFTTMYDATNARMYAVRIYNKVLSDSERTTNYNSDVVRFFS